MSTQAVLDDLKRQVPETVGRAESEMSQLKEQDISEYLDPASWVVGEIARALAARAEEGDLVARDTLIAMAGVLEQWMQADEVPGDIELLVDSFLIYIPSPGDASEAIYHALGSCLKERVDAERDYRNDPVVSSFVQRLVSAVPSLDRIAAEHRFGYHHEVLVNAFLGDVAVRLQSIMSDGRSLGIDDTWDQTERDRARHLFMSFDDDRELEFCAVIEFLESEMAVSPEIENVIAMGFLEALPYEDEDGSEVLAMLGPRLRSEVDQQRDPEHG